MGEFTKTGADFRETYNEWCSTQELPTVGNHHPRLGLTQQEEGRSPEPSEGSPWGGAVASARGTQPGEAHRWGRGLGPPCLLLAGRPLGHRAGWKRVERESGGTEPLAEAYRLVEGSRCRRKRSRGEDCQVGQRSQVKGIA